MGIRKLTKRAYWDNCWEKISLPVEIKKSPKTPYLNEILSIFDKYMPKNEQLSILEIGGAPGQYLAYMHSNFGYEVHCLDYSEIGCKKTKENFKLLNIRGNVYQEDIFSKELNLPSFDIVYSLGFIEHFSDLDTVIQKHLELLKPGGILLIGAPNLRGINHWFLKRLAPQRLYKHNLSAMDISNWKSFEEKFKLKPLFKGYIGGFEPGILHTCEKKSFSNLILLTVVKLLCFCFNSRPFRIFRRLNSKYYSGYVIGVYKKP
ncbi:class I SAM-dependent methyltransferase [bacterium]|nr:class I SAM-dependent methyltransferase [bacterium]